MAIAEFRSEAELRAHYAAVRKRVSKWRLKLPPPLPRPLPVLCEAPPRTFSQSVIHTVCCWFHIGKLEIMSTRKTADIGFPRQVVYYLLHRHTSMSLPLIGQVVGGRDHTTILYGVRKIKRLRDEDAQVAALLAHLEDDLGLGAEWAV